MKKIFALALAAVMTAGMATVSFAASKKNLVLDILGSSGEAVMVVYDSDDDGTLRDEKSTTLADLKRVDGGTELYILISDYDKKSLVRDDADVKGYKIEADWFQGKAEKPKFETIKYEQGYAVAVKVVVPEDGDKVQDLIGDITIYRDKKEDGNDEYRTAKIDLSFGYNEANYDEAGFDYDTAELVTFKGADGEEIMSFGDDFEFEVDVTGQSKVNLKHNRDFDKEFAAMYDYANIDFIKFEKEPTFNKIGTAYIYADEDAYIYEVTADGAKAIKGLEWDEDYEAWTFKTRTLKAYAISDVELDEQTVTEDKTEDESSKTDDGVKENPDTGR